MTPVREAPARSAAPVNEKRQAQGVIQRLARLIAEDRPILWLVVCFAVLLGVLGLATPVAVQSLVNFVAFGGLMQPLIVVGILLLFFLAFSGAVRVFKAYLVEILQRRLFFRVARGLATRLPRVKLEAHDRKYGPELVNRFFDVLTIQKAGSALMIDGLDILLQSTIGLLVLGFYHPLLLVFDAVLIAAIAFIIFGLGRGAVTTARRESAAKYRVAAALEEIAHSPVSYKVASSTDFAEERLAALTDEYLNARKGHYRVVLRQLTGAVTLHALAGTALLTLGGFLVIQGQLTLGQLVAAELIVSIALTSFVKFGKQLESFYDMLAGVEKLGVLFDLPLDEDRGEEIEAVAQAASLELRNVDYHHAGRLEALERFSAHIKSGERVAYIARRNSGKSTVAEIFAGLRVPESGLALFDGVDMRDVANSSLRPQLELVQGIDMVEGTILENVRLGREHIRVEDVRATLARFGILDEVMALPDGIHTRVTVSGDPLSRRTAQLLMLARAIADGPRAVLVDGVLDELDDRQLEHCLKGLRESSATIVVFTGRDDIAARLDRQEVLPTACRSLTLQASGGAL